LRLLVMLLLLLLLFRMESLRAVPSALRSLDMPLVVLESLRIVPSVLRLVIEPDGSEVAVAPRVVFVEALSLIGIAVLLVLPVALESRMSGCLVVPGVPATPRLVLDEELSVIGMALVLVPVLLRMSGCLVVPGDPGAPGLVDCAWPMPATNVSAAATAMPRAMKWFMVRSPVMVWDVSKPVYWIERMCRDKGKARAQDADGRRCRARWYRGHRDTPTCGTVYRHRAKRPHYLAILPTPFKCGLSNISLMTM